MTDTRELLASLRELEESVAWQEVKRVLTDQRDRCLREIASIETPLENVPYLRGQLSVCDFVLSRPDVFLRQCEFTLSEMEEGKLPLSHPRIQRTPRY